MDVAITSAQLKLALAGVFPPQVLDVRPRPAYDADTQVVRGALRREPQQLARWAPHLDPGRIVVVYCVHGNEVSQDAAAALRAQGHKAVYLEGGIEAWRGAGGELQAKPPARPTLWVTRERPKIDRIACPWLIRRFIDGDARFLYVPKDQVFQVAAETGAVPYDITGAEFSHDGSLCSFDAFITKYRLTDPALLDLAVIVRGADTAELRLAPEAPGLLALSLGLSRMFTDDQEMLRYGMLMYDALYAWRREARDERHSWNPQG